MEQKKIKVMTVFGTRPEAIKMAPIVLELQKHPDTIVPVVAVTAQHREMLDQVLNLFHIKPDHDLNIMAAGQTLFDITTRAMMGLDKVLTEEKPDIVLVHGDTTTTFAGALAAYYHQTAVGHVEAGLRTHNKYSPFPEEMNRRLTGCIADLNFAPTSTSEANLLAENVPPESIFVTATRSSMRFITRSAMTSTSRRSRSRTLTSRISASSSSRRTAARTSASRCAMSTRRSSS